MKTFDCFLFFNELDLLELRLNVLDRYVDYFVIVESAITFQGEKKDFIFEKYRHRFKRFENKIIYYKVDDRQIDYSNLPYIEAPKTADEAILNQIYRHIEACPHFDKKQEFWWGNDFYQRECIWRGLAVAGPEPADLVMISDLDEIPDPETVVALKGAILPESVICLRQHEFCYYLNYYHNSDWIGTCCFQYSSFMSHSLNAIRFSAKRDEGLSPQIIGNGGWHFTSIGSVEAIKNKIRSWGHREYNTGATLSGVEYNVRHGYDIFRRPGFGRLQCLPLNHDLLPLFLVQNIDGFQHLIGPEIETETFFQRVYHTHYSNLRWKVDAVARKVRLLF